MRRNQPSDRKRPAGPKRGAIAHHAAPPSLPVFTFGQSLTDTCRAQPLQNLANLNYQDELRLKNDAFAVFWRAHHLHGSPQEIIPSPLPRHYRTTSKRRVDVTGGRLRLIAPDGGADAHLLEPREHATIYEAIRTKTSHNAPTALARALNHAIIRGTYEERMLILNVSQMSGPIVNQARELCDILHQADSKLAGAFLYLDPTRSEYYLEAQRPDAAVSFKKIFGYDRFRLAVDSLKFQIEPTSFSQVNQSMLPLLIKTVREMFEPDGNGRLLDLFCGYGLFSYALGSGYREVVGIDAAKSSIASAIAAQKFNPHPARTRFLLRMISGNALQESLPPSGTIQEDAILDPPKSGCDDRVIDAVACRKPRKVVHIFCGTDEIPRSLAAWEKAGYRVQRVVALDMFAGTPNLETVILLKPVELLSC